MHIIKKPNFQKEERERKNIFDLEYLEKPNSVTDMHTKAREDVEHTTWEFKGSTYERKRRRRERGRKRGVPNLTREREMLTQFHKITCIYKIALNLVLVSSYMPN